MKPKILPDYLKNQNRFKGNFDVRISVDGNRSWLWERKRFLGIIPYWSKITSVYEHDDKTYASSGPFGPREVLQPSKEWILSEDEKPDDDRAVLGYSMKFGGINGHRYGFPIIVYWDQTKWVTEDDLINDYEMNPDFHYIVCWMDITEPIFKTKLVNKKLKFL